MGWRKTDKEDVWLQWSVLRHVHYGLMVPRGMEKTVALGGLVMSFLPASPDQSNYDVLTFEECKRPCLVFEQASGAERGVTGGIGWRDEYRLTVRSSVYGEGGSAAAGDLELQCFLHVLRTELRGKLDLYDFTALASPVLIKKDAFEIRYMNHVWIPNEKEPSGNYTEMMFAVER